MCGFYILFLFIFCVWGAGRRIIGDRLSCKMAWTGLAGTALLSYLIQAFHVYVFMWLFLINHLEVTVSHYTTSCAVAQRRVANVTGLLVLPSYAHARSFSGRMRGEK